MILDLYYGAALVTEPAMGSYVEEGRNWIERDLPDDQLNLLAYNLGRVLAANLRWKGMVAIASSYVNPGDPTRAERVRSDFAGKLAGEGRHVKVLWTPAAGTQASKCVEEAMDSYMDVFGPHPNPGDVTFYLKCPEGTWFGPGNHDGAGMRRHLDMIGRRFPSLTEETPAKAVFLALDSPAPDPQEFHGKSAGGRKELRVGLLNAFFPKLRVDQDSFVNDLICLPCEPGFPFLIAARELLYHIRQDWEIIAQCLEAADARKWFVPLRKPGFKKLCLDADARAFVVLLVDFAGTEADFENIRYSVETVATGGTAGLFRNALTAT